MYFAAREKYDPYFNLHEDDIQGIQNLYGFPTNPDHPSDTIASTGDDNNDEIFTDSYNDPKFPEKNITPQPIIPDISEHLYHPDNHYSSFPQSPISKNILPYLNHCNYRRRINNQKRAQACFRILTLHSPSLFSNS